MNSRNIIPSLLFFAFISLFCGAERATGNGAVWSPGVASAPPRPLKQNDLLLTKEHVVFKDGKVIAKFWILNPTNKRIHVTMGFPLEYKDSAMARTSIEEYASQLLDNFEVEVNGKEVDAVLAKDFTNDYPVVINWEMDYAPHKTTEFIVTYPMSGSHGSSDNPGLGSEWSRSFRYITHTGAYWSGPIKEALFEYCSPEVSFLVEHPSGGNTYWTKNGLQKNEQYMGASPKPYRIDKKRNCIVWEMKNWTPSADISVSINGGYSHYGDAWGYKSDTEIWAKWCGLSKEYEGRYFFDTIRLSDTLLTGDRYKKLMDESYIYLSGSAESCNGDWCDPFYDFPVHLKTDYELILLRYLRNSIFAALGYEFKDEELRICFANVQKKSEQINATEKANVEFLQSLEKEVRKINKKSWDEVKINTQSE